MFSNLKKTVKSFYEQFVRFNDSPQRIAFGFGVGVFLGILPFTGVLAAVGVAWYFHLNKPAAILGSVITNTWLGFIVLGLSIHLSCIILGLNFQDIQLKFQALMKDFHWASLSDIFVLKIISAVVIGYLILSIFLSVLAYFICLGFIYLKREKRAER